VALHLQRAAKKWMSVFRKSRAFQGNEGLLRFNQIATGSSNGIKVTKIKLTTASCKTIWAHVFK
jgi:hypothetical protein